MGGFKGLNGESTGEKRMISGNGKAVGVNILHERTQLAGRDTIKTPQEAVQMAGTIPDAELGVFPSHEGAAAAGKALGKLGAVGARTVEFRDRARQLPYVNAAFLAAEALPRLGTSGRAVPLGPVLPEHAPLRPQAKYLLQLS